MTTYRLEIPQIAVRQDAWKKISKSIVETVGWQNALRQVEIFQSDEAKQFYLKGWVVTVNVTDVDNACLKEALVKLVNDNASIEQLLQKYALRQVCMGKSLKDRTDRLNRTLNIQWAIEIAAQFPKAEVEIRLSTNLDTWLHEITDEDDRDDIKNWAGKVKDGKMLEDKFIEKVKNMN